MKRKLLLTAIAATLLAGAGGLVLAQDAASPSAAPAARGMQGGHDWHSMHGMMHGHGKGMRHGMHGHRHGGPAAAVIGDLRQISRLYVMEGKAGDLPAFYNGVLAKTQNPMVRNYVYHNLARVQMRPADTQAAIATLRKNLDENLTRLNAEKPHKR